MKAVTTLKTNKAVGPMNGRFVALIHPKTAYDLFSDPVFQAVLSYARERGDNNPFITGFIGTAFGIDFFETPNGYSAANSQPIDVFSSMIFGKGSFGIGGLAAFMPAMMKETEQSNHTFDQVRPLRLIDKPFGSTGVADPFDRLASIAWYTTYVTKVLDATFYVRVEHDVAL
jgi:N4-gp56 family major capsid protein